MKQHIFNLSIYQIMDNNDSTTTQITAISQLDKANEVLKGLSVNVTTDDRRAVEKKYSFSRFTTVAYLKGEGKDLDTAMKLIDFFRNRIDGREKALA